MRLSRALIVGLVITAIVMLAQCQTRIPVQGPATSGPAQTVRISVEGMEYVPTQVTVERGRPVKFIVEGTRAQGCVQYFSLPTFGINVKLLPGDNVFEFTPQEEGTFPFSCSMNMARRRLHVVEAGQTVSSSPSPSLGFLPGEGKDAQSLPEARSPQIIEVDDGAVVDLEASFVRKSINGIPYIMYAYNGQIPGPIFKTKQASTITVKFRNNIDLNTTIHWHGLRHDVRDDGVPITSQAPIKPGESFTYTVSFPDAGIYWYHPHIREDIQQDMGLASSMLVGPADSLGWNPVDREEMLFLDDLLIEDGKLVPYGKDHANFALMGRFGNVLMVNGKTDYTFSVNKDDVVRFYITNVANVRPFNISFGGAKMKRIGSDLSRYEQEEFVDGILIAPGERYIIEVLFDKQGEVPIVHMTPEQMYQMGTIIVKDIDSPNALSTQFTKLLTNKDIQEDIASFKKFFAKPIDYTFDLAIDMPGMMGMMGQNTMMGGMDGHMEGGMMAMMTPEGPIEWEDTMATMNRNADTSMLRWILRDQESKKENMDFMMKAKVGDVLKIRLINRKDSMHPMQHPIHLHGQRFIVLTIDGKPIENKVWKDTVLVPICSTVDILVDVTNPGTWMMHCHISEHLEAGMMTALEVESR